jgi:cytoskeletal protein RodZ
MNSKAWLALILVLAIIIAVLAWMLFTTPAQTTPAPTSAQATTSVQSVTTASVPTASSSQPLDTQVTVTTPAANATVSHSFEIAGTAPGAWFYEAVFPIQVRDANDDLVGSSQGQAQGDWTQPGLVTFTSQMTIDASYEGPANLILLKDNPSGLPQNIDSVTIPITIQ